MCAERYSENKYLKIKGALHCEKGDLMILFAIVDKCIHEAREVLGRSTQI